MTERDSGVRQVQSEGGEKHNARLPIPIPTEPLQEFCQRNHIRRLAVFGSALREGDGLMDRFEELREKVVPLLKPYV